MIVYVVIISKDGCEPNCYVYSKKEDAIKAFCAYKDTGVKVVLEEAELR